MDKRINKPSKDHSHLEEILIAAPGYPFERLPGNGDGHEGYACFACDRSMRAGEPFVAVSRLWQISENGKAQGKVIDATASLQVCIPCTLAASTYKLNWKSKPKIVESEFNSFYIYARSLADIITRSRSDACVDKRSLIEVLFLYENFDINSVTVSFESDRYCELPFYLLEDGQCYECSRTISSVMPHMLIKLAVNIPMHDSTKLYNTWTAARYCDACAKGLFPIDGNNRLDYTIW